ncbi:SGNH/GDSL hydrolase family protein [Candidatus Woesearchaeota archaeon]|nr:SGNH/GDSL hydrolase family protein [Candidatus Woesearchaeota archaeon]
MNHKFFAKFTIDNQLTNEALQKIKTFRISLAVLGILFIATVLLAKHRKSGIIGFLEAHKTGIQNLMLLLAVILALILLTELSLRFMLPEEFKRTLPAGALKASQKIELNDEGYRDLNHQLMKRNVYRIAVLGDSFTFGTGIENMESTYPKILQTKLNAKARTIKYGVFNFGKEGVDTEYEIKILQQYALKYNPDIIIVGYVLNDFRDAASQNKRNFYLFWADKYIERKSYLYSLIKKSGVNLLESIGVIKSYQKAIAESFYSDKNKEINRAYILEMDKIAKNNNATLVVVAIPFIYNLDDYPFSHAHEFLKDTAAQNRILYLDTLPQLSKFNESDIVVSRYDWHPNEMGHKIIAESIYNYMLESGLVK